MERQGKRRRRGQVQDEDFKDTRRNQEVQSKFQIERNWKKMDRRWTEEESSQIATSLLPTSSADRGFSKEYSFRITHTTGGKHYINFVRRLRTF
ncbi:hypothetical protein Trydic_g15776 [Trypoxylus dichotomus]